jgi:hypothetical protein
MTTLPEIKPDVDYPLARPTGSNPLTNPSHSELHSSTSTAIESIDNRLEILETIVKAITAPDGNIAQARLAAHEWAVHGQLDPVQNNMLLIPLIWNITGRTVKFDGAKATLLTEADANVVIDIVIGAELSGPEHDESGGTQTTILTSQLVIPAGELVSQTLGPGDFSTDHSINTYVGAFVESIGSASAPGGDLTIQLNRLL